MFVMSFRDYKYFNDLYSFDLESYRWCKVKVAGIPPAPRSACQVAVTQDQRHLLIYGGYSKERIKKDVDKGCIHSDMFMVTLEGKTNLRFSLPIHNSWY